MQLRNFAPASVPFMVHVLRDLNGYASGGALLIWSAVTRFKDSQSTSLGHFYRFMSTSGN